MSRSRAMTRRRSEVDQPKPVRGAYLPGLTALRCVAAVLITNSHLDTLYPIPALATGGSLGNALFFALSGYGLALSRTLNLPFPRWFGKRLSRVYPSTLIVTLVVVMLTRPDWAGSIAGVVRTFIYPTPYWFVAALVAFYVLAYPVLRSRSPAVALAAAGVAVIPYAVIYLTSTDTSVWAIEGDGWLKYMFYWQTMMLGIAFAFSRERRSIPVARAGVGLTGALVAYFGVKYALTCGLGYEWQFLVHALTLAALAYALSLGESWDGFARLIKSRVGPAVALVASLTLEIYLVQYRVYSAAPIQKLPFPASVVTFVALTLIAAWVVNRASGLLRSACRRLPGDPLHSEAGKRPSGQDNLLE